MWRGELDIADGFWYWAGTKVKLFNNCWQYLEREYRTCRNLSDKISQIVKDHSLFLCRHKFQRNQKRSEKVGESERTLEKVRESQKKSEKAKIVDICQFYARKWKKLGDCWSWKIVIDCQHLLQKKNITKLTIVQNRWKSLTIFDFCQQYSFEIGFLKKKQFCPQTAFIHTPHWTC